MHRETSWCYNLSSSQIYIKGQQATYCSFKTYHLCDAVKAPAFSEKHVIRKSEIKIKCTKWKPSSQRLWMYGERKYTQDFSLGIKPIKIK